MPQSTVDLGKAAKAKYPGAYDHVDDAELGRQIKTKFPGAYDHYADAPSPAAPQTWAQKLGLTSGPGLRGDIAETLDLAEGIASGAARSVYKGGDVIRRLQGAPRIINQPDVQRAMAAPPSYAGQAGQIGEQIAETVIPGTALTKALRGYGIGARIVAEGLLGGTQAAIQSGGDPLATGIGTLLGGAGGAMGGSAAAAKPLTAETRSLDYLSKQGVPITAGVRSGAPFLRAIEKASAYSPLGAVVAKQTERRTSEALSKSAQQLLKQAHVSPVTAEQAGMGARQTLTQSAEQSEGLADEAYDLFRQAEADPSNIREVQLGTELAENGKRVPVYGEVPLPVDIRDTKKWLKPIYEDMLQWWEPAKRNASAGFQAIRSILDAPDYVPASIAEKGLSGLKELAREGGGRSQGLAKMIIPQVQESIDRTAAAAGPDVLDAIQAGRAATAKKFTTQAVLKTLREEPVQAFGQLTWGNDANINLLRRVDKEAPGELAKVGRAYLQNVLKKATEEGEFGLKRAAGMFRDWQDLGPGQKQLMFKNPKLIEDLDNFFLGMRKLSENPNPSGTALVAIASSFPGYIWHDPIGGGAYTLAAGAAAKLLYSPGFAKLMTQMMTTPAAQTARSVGLFRHAMRSIPTQVLQPMPVAAAGR